MLTANVHGLGVVTDLEVFESDKNYLVMGRAGTPHAAPIRIEVLRDGVTLSAIDYGNNGRSVNAYAEFSFKLSKKP